MFARNWKRIASVTLGMLFAFSLTAWHARADEVHSVEYRLVKWKTLHFHDAQKAELHLKTVKTLGCEAKMDAHDGHFDVSYRCPNWRLLNVKSHDSAHQWEDWLKKAGFETKHQH